MVETHKPSQPRRSRKPVYKIDPAKVLALSKQGLNNCDIARHQGVTPSAIWRFLDRVQAEKVRLQAFKDGRADALAMLHADSVQILELGMRSLDKDMQEDGVFHTQTPNAKANILRDMAVVNGVLFDKERLERGQSTQNVSVIERMLDASHEQIYKPNNGKNNGTVDITPQKNT